MSVVLALKIIELFKCFLKESRRKKTPFRFINSRVEMLKPQSSKCLWRNLGKSEFNVHFLVKNYKSSIKQ